MDSKEAISLIEALVATTVYATSEGYRRRKGVTKIAVKEVNRATANVFKALVGRKPTAEELKQITD